MNWEAIGSIGEIVGAAAVLITLIYLALQVRQANQIAYLEMHNESITHYMQNNNNIISDPETARIFREGLINLESLTPTERIRLNYILQNIVASFNHIRQAYDKGFYEQEIFDSWLGYVCGILNMPGGQIYWKEGKGYPSNLRETITQGMATMPRLDENNPSFWLTNHEDSND